jgi:hypothetical protein
LSLLAAVVAEEDMQAQAEQQTMGLAEVVVLCDTQTIFP